MKNTNFNPKNLTKKNCEFENIKHLGNTDSKSNLKNHSNKNALTNSEKIEFTAKKILKKHIKAFEVLGNGEIE